MLPRAGLTAGIIKQLNQDIALDDAIMAWWYDIRPTGGLRLTDTGFDVLADMIELQHWQFDIPAATLTARNLLALDRFMTCPYYLRRKGKNHYLILFGDKESMLASLYGDVEKFIAGLAVQ